MKAVVLDTNVFVAASFKLHSDSARIVEAVEDGRLSMVWSKETREETEHILRKIPPIEWRRYEELFEPELRYDGTLDTESFDYVPDPPDRMFAALALATGAVLVTMDEHLLAERDRGSIPILPPTEFLRHFGSEIS